MAENTYAIKCKAGIKKFLNNYTKVESENHYHYCREFLKNAKNIDTPPSKSWYEVAEKVNMFFGDFVIYTKNNGDHLFSK